MPVKGTIRYAGYKTGGQVPFKGMKNKRKAKKRKIKEAEMRLKRQREIENEEYLRKYSDEWDTDYRNYR